MAEFSTGGGSASGAQSSVSTTTGTPYDFPSGQDPVWDAFLARYRLGTTSAEEKAKLERAQQEIAHREALDQLAQRGLVGRRNLDTNLLARGVFNAGEATTRRDELGTTLAQARTSADNTFTGRMNRIDAERLAALQGLDADREVQVAAARERQAQKARDEEAARLALSNAGTSAAAASGGGGSAPAPTAPAQSAYVGEPSSNESGRGYSTAGTGQGDDLLSAITRPNATQNHIAASNNAASNESGRGYSSAPRRAAPAPRRPSPLRPYQGPR